MRTFAIAAILLATCGCVSHYSRPATAAQPLTETVSAPRDKLYNACAYVLRTSGYRIGFSNKSRGRISTVPRKRRLSRAECDCGAAMGRRYITDPNTSTDVAVTIIVGEETFTVQATIYGTHSSDSPAPAKTLHCVSLGSIERHLAGRIKAYLSQKSG